MAWASAVRAAEWRRDAVVVESQHHALMRVGQVVAMVHPDSGIRSAECDLPYLAWPDVECVHPQRTSGLPVDGVPSLDRISTGWPCRCQGCVSRLRLTTVNRTMSPLATSWSGMEGWPRPLTVCGYAGWPSTMATARSRTMVKCRSALRVSKGTAAGAPYRSRSRSEE